LLRVFPTEISDEQRFPAYSGATVPDSHRLPVTDVLRDWLRHRRALQYRTSDVFLSVQVRSKRH
jgi:hypothetical protein